MYMQPSCFRQNYHFHISTSLCRNDDPNIFCVNECVVFGRVGAHHAHCTHHAEKLIKLEISCVKQNTGLEN